MQSTVLVVFGDLFVRLCVCGLWYMISPHSGWLRNELCIIRECKKQINLINTFKMTMIFSFFIFMSYLTVKRTFLGDLDLVQYKSPQTVSWGENTTKRGITWFFVTFICKVLKFSFLDGGHFVLVCSCSPHVCAMPTRDCDRQCWCSYLPPFGGDSEHAVVFLIPP